MRAENAKLKSAIELIAAAARPDDRPTLRIKIQEAIVIARLEDHVSAGSQSTDSAAHNTESFAPHELLNSSHSTNEDIRRNAVFSQPGSTEPTNCASPVKIGLSSLSATNSINSDIRLDPFQLCGCKDGFGAILPFMGRGGLTFAGRMFWHLVERCEAATAPGSALQVLSLTDVSYEFQELVKSLDCRRVDIKSWATAIQRRVESHQRTAVADVPPLPLASDTQMWQTSRWLSPVFAERRIREIVGDEVFGVLASPMLDEMQRKNSALVGSPLINDLLDKLTGSYVCYGSGPHWEANSLDATVGEWCRSIIKVV